MIGVCLLTTCTVDSVPSADNLSAHEAAKVKASLEANPTVSIDYTSSVSLEPEWRKAIHVIREATNSSSVWRSAVVPITVPVFVSSAA